MIPKLFSHRESFLNHFIYGCDGFGICLIGALHNDHIGQSRFHSDIGVFQSFAVDRCPGNGIARTIGPKYRITAIGTLAKERISGTVQALFVLKMVEGNPSDSALTPIGKVGNDSAVGSDAVLIERSA